MLRTRQTAVSDYATIASVVDEWWGRPIIDKLPHLFLEHFWRASSVVEDAAGLAGFLIGFMSPSQLGVGYIHFVGVRPDVRSAGLARQLYESFFDRARAAGCDEVHAVTDPRNTVSIAFHQRMGFAVSGPLPDYDGPGRPSVTFRRSIA